MAFNLQDGLNQFLMQQAAMQQGGGGNPLEGIIPPAPPGSPPNTQPLSMDQAQGGGGIALNPNPLQTSAPQEEPQYDGEAIVSKGLDPIEHKGMFGIKGKFRDVLGLLGDAFLVQSGNKASYQPRREQERQSDIFAGGYQNNDEENFMNNPLMVIQKMAEAGYGEQATELYKQHVANQNDKAKIQATQGRNQALNRASNLTGDKNAIGNVSRLLSNIRDDDDYQSRKDGIIQYLMTNDDGSGSLARLAKDLPDQFDDSIRNWGLEQYQAQRLEDYDVGLGISQQNANTAARRPPPQQRSQSTLEYFQEISRIPPSKRTPEQNAYIKKYTNTGGSRTRTGSIKGQPTASSGRPGAFTGQTRTNKRTGVTQKWDGKSWK